MAKGNVQEREKDDEKEREQETEGETETETTGAERGGEGEGETEAEEKPTVYALAVQATGLEYDDAEYNDIDEYKSAVCRAIGKLSDADFEALPDPLTDWQTAAAKVIKENRSKPKGDRKKALPVMPGLAGEKEPKGKAAKKVKEPKAKKEKAERDPNNNRIYAIGKLFVEDMAQTDDNLIAAVKKAKMDYSDLTVVRVAGYLRIARRLFVDAGVMKK